MFATCLIFQHARPLPTAELDNHILYFLGQLRLVGKVRHLLRQVQFSVVDVDDADGGPVVDKIRYILILILSYILILFVLSYLL